MRGYKARLIYLKYSLWCTSSLAISFAFSSNKMTPTKSRSVVVAYWMLNSGGVFGVTGKSVRDIARVSGRLTGVGILLNKN